MVRLGRGEGSSTGPRRAETPRRLARTTLNAKPRNTIFVQLRVRIPTPAPISKVLKSRGKTRPFAYRATQNMGNSKRSQRREVTARLQVQLIRICRLHDSRRHRDL